MISESAVPRANSFCPYVSRITTRRIAHPTRRPGKASFEKLRQREEHPSVTDRITRDNAARLAAEGQGAFEAVYADLAADRARSYASIGETG